MAIINYEFDYNQWEGTVHFEVNTDIYTKEHAQSTLDFFLWETPYDKDADPIDEVMKKYALQCLKEGSFDNLSVQGLKEKFKDMEGFNRIDGVHGITLTLFSGYELDEEELFMKKRV